MKSFGASEIAKDNWGGFKRPLRDALLWPPINLLARLVSDRVPVSAASATFHGDGFDISLLRPRDCQVATELARHGGRFTHPSDDLVLQHFQRLARRSASFLDIGSYTGLFSLVAAKANPNIRVHAFEIVPETFLLAQSNVIANDLVGRVSLHLHGLGDRPSEVHIPATLNTASLPSSLSLGSAFSGGVRIPVDRLDDLLPDLAGPMVIKIDVEGFEPQVLAGAYKTLERLKPDIIIEVLKDQGPEVEAILKPLGYSFWHFTDDGLVKKDKLQGVRVQRDWLLTCRADAVDLA